MSKHQISVTTFVSATGNSKLTGKFQFLLTLPQQASENFTCDRRGLNFRQAAYAVKKYKSHRCIPANIMMDINIISRGASL